MQEDEGIVQLHEFDPMSMLRHDSRILCVGQSGSGKTVMMQYLLYCLSKKIDLAVVFCPTRDTRQEYERSVPKCFVYPSYDKKQLARICNAQKKLSQRIGDAEARGSRHDPLRRVAVVLDDCMFDKAEMSSKAMRYLMMNGRHDNFCFLNGVQYVVDFPKDLRSQIDVVIVFPESSPEYREPLRKNLLGIFHTDEQLVRTFNEGLRAHEALVFDSRAYREKRTCLFFCKAQYPLPRFRVGSDMFWRMYYKYFVRRSCAFIEEDIKNTLAIAKGAGAPDEDDSGKPTSGLIMRLPLNMTAAEESQMRETLEKFKSKKAPKATKKLATLKPSSLIDLVDE